MSDEIRAYRTQELPILDEGNASEARSAAELGGGSGVVQLAKRLLTAGAKQEAGAAGATTPATGVAAHDADAAAVTVSQAKLEAITTELARLQRAQSTLRAAIAARTGVALSPRGGGVPADLASVLAVAEASAATARSRKGVDPAILAADAAGGLPASQAPSTVGGPPRKAGGGPPGSVSAGLTGFAVAGDLLEIDFSPAAPPEPEVCVAPRFDAVPAVRAPPTATAAAGAAIAADPAALAAWLDRVETQYRVVLALLEGVVAGKGSP
jgi:hypothetical protein